MSEIAPEKECGRDLPNEGNKKCHNLGAGGWTEPMAIEGACGSVWSPRSLDETRLGHTQMSGREAVIYLMLGAPRFAGHESRKGCSDRPTQARPVSAILGHRLDWVSKLLRVCDLPPFSSA